ncbi:SUN domain-containing protein 1-like isoform X2 [Bacillus rossius redtenbacheri]|uniref:SUN domain-containing protein 1-like isoform X2 n=1 Tax=Bacillus rossius redtenbacheri TaxID=93214 RepID=UPI002FDE18B8
MDGGCQQDCPPFRPLFARTTGTGGGGGDGMQPIIEEIRTLKLSQKLPAHGSEPSAAHALEELRAANRSLTSRWRAFEETIDALRHELNEIKSNIHNVCALDSVQAHIVRRVVNHSLDVYDADKTGLADYALESAGGEIVDSPIAVKRFVLECLAFLGLPAHGHEHSACCGPRCVLQPSVQPGHCWTFEGATDKVTIRLARKIHVSAVTVEHTPATIAISGDVTCAPKHFVVYAMVLGKSPRLVEQRLGSYEFKVPGPPLQTFRIQDAPEEATGVVRVSFRSNHGHPRLTCVCRLRVHGTEATARSFDPARG